MLETLAPRMTYDEVSETLGTFEVEPLDRGFGNTFGNSLRRVLLSSLEGAAVTSIRIDGVQHEFSTIEGVRENVIDIILNLRGLVCRIHGEADDIEVEVTKRGPGTVTAGDIQCPADLEILNPDLEIANLNKGANLEMILTISRGVGYVRSENQTTGGTIGVIPVDSAFSPVRRVRYEVGSARVGQRTDYDKLTLEIETDGSVTPRDAMAHAAETLISRLSMFANPVTAQEVEPVEEESPQSELFDVEIEELELGVRAFNCLRRVGIETIGDLLSKTEGELGAIPNFGRKSIEEVKEVLAAQGLNLRADD